MDRGYMGVNGAGLGRIRGLEGFSEGGAVKINGKLGSKRGLWERQEGNMWAKQCKMEGNKAKWK